MARPHALVAVSLLGAATAHADPIDLPDTRATITLDGAWTPAPSPGLVAGYRAGDGRSLAITRAQVPNIAAWREKTRDDYVSAIAGGLADHTRVTKQLGRIEGVPVLDLEALSPRGTSIVVRVILFRTYALALAIEGPRTSVAAARAIAKTFVPPPARPEGSP